MSTLLFLEDCYKNRREFFQFGDIDKAIILLKEWVLENKDRDVFLYEIKPGIERCLMSGYDLFRANLKQNTNEYIKFNDIINDFDKWGHML